MKLLEWLKPGPRLDLDALSIARDRLWLSTMGAAAAVVLLSLALVCVALMPRPHVVVPPADAPRLQVPGQPPEEAVRSFALLYVMTFDNYTPATVETAATALKARIAPGRWSEVADEIDRRSRIVVEGRMSSHAIADPSVEVRREGGLFSARVSARRRLFISDRLSKETLVRYHLTIEPCPPTTANPNGLAVAAQRVEESDEARR